MNLGQFGQFIEQASGDDEQGSFLGRPKQTVPPVVLGNGKVFCVPVPMAAASTWTRLKMH